jgi:hypothetical protein
MLDIQSRCPPLKLLCRVLNSATFLAVIYIWTARLFSFLLTFSNATYRAPVDQGYASRMSLGMPLGSFTYAVYVRILRCETFRRPLLVLFPKATAS